MGFYLVGDGLVASSMRVFLRMIAKEKKDAVCTSH